MNAQATRKRARRKPKKPSQHFPLFAHANGQWCKKIRGRLHYFGKWDDPDAALERFLREKDALYAGRRPRAAGDEPTVKDLLDRFHHAKLQLLEAGELSQRSFDDYVATCKRIRDLFGRERVLDDLDARDFEKLRAVIAKRWGPVALGNEINRVRIIFKYGFEAGVLATPMRFGPHFKRPSRKVLRKARHAKGPRMFGPAEIRAMLRKAGPQLRAMILLGINCGFGNTDVGAVQLRALDLADGWINFPRPKTGIPRRVPLWPETVTAIRAVLDGRKSAKKPQDDGLLFLTRCGAPWAKSVADSPVSKETAKLLTDLGIKRPGLNFYALRHTTETIGGEAGDQAAVDAIMGHAPRGDDMSAVYRERMTDERLRKVTDHIHAWLYGSETERGGEKPKAK